MNGDPVQTVWCVVRLIRHDTGAEYTQLYTSFGDDHRAAATAAFEALTRTTGITIREIYTFDGEPRRWDPRHEVEEILPYKRPE